MKKVLFIVLACGLYLSVFSQETEKLKPDGKNEIKINLLMSLLSYPDISYERNMSHSIGLGLSAGIPLVDNDTKYHIMPYCRFYFGESWIKSFFIETNVAILGVKKYYYDSNYTYLNAKIKVDCGLGVAYGYKYVNRSGFIGELFLGLGRSLENNYYPRIGISLGKQF